MCYYYTYSYVCMSYIYDTNWVFYILTGLTTRSPSASLCTASHGPSVVCNDHSYAKPYVASSQSCQVKRKRKGQNYLTSTEDIDDLHKSLSHTSRVTCTIRDDTVQAPETCDFVQGDQVLVSLNGRSVACGQVLGGSRMHGRDVPDGFTVISLNEVMDSKCPLQLRSSFDDDDDDVLMIGMITGWPTRLLKKL